MAQTLLNINQYGATYGGASNAYQFYLVVTLNSQSTANNTSNITVTHSANGRNGWGYSGFSTPTSTITVGGTQRVSSTVAGIPTNGSSVTLSTWTGNVTHNNDGTLSLAVSATYNPNTTGYSYVPRTNTLSGTITLPTIPRASDVSVSNYTISNTTGSISATITSRANFYHRWRWKVGSGSWSGWNNKGLISTTSSTVTVSNSNLLSRMPSDKSATFTIEVATYSDSNYANYVGTKSASATLTVTIKPSVSLGNIAINTSPISGYAVAGYSTVKATWSATAGSGASNGTTYFTISTGSVTASSSTASSGTVTSTTIPGSASNYTLTITAYTVDSRGLRSDNVSKSITVYGYQPPTATLSAYRVANSTSTTEDGAGVYVYVTFSGAVRSTVNSQNSIQSTRCTYSGSISGTATNGQHIALADSQSATFTLTVRDKVTSSTAIVSVAPALYPLDLYDNGQGAVGVAFGTTAERGMVKSALPIRSESYGSFGGAIYADGGGITAGNTSLAGQDINMGAHSIAGKIYFRCGNSATDAKDIWVMNNAGTYALIMRVGQNNNATFYGLLSGHATSATELMGNTIPNGANLNSTTYLQGTWRCASSADFNSFTNKPEGSKTTCVIVTYRHSSTSATDTWYYATQVFHDFAGQEWRRMIIGSGTAGSNTVGAWRKVESTTSLWTGTLYGGATINLNVNGYSRLRIYAQSYAGSIVFEMDLTHASTNTSTAGNVYARTGVSIHIATVAPETHYCECEVVRNKTQFLCRNTGYIVGTTNNARNNNSSYFVYKIEGIL